MGNNMENMPHDEPLELEALASTLQARRASQVKDASISDPQCSKAEPIPVRDRAATPELDPDQRPIGGELIGGKPVNELEDSHELSQDIGPDRDVLDLGLEVDMDLELDLELEPELMALAESLDPLSQPESFSPFSSSDASSRWSTSTQSPGPVKGTPPPSTQVKVKPLEPGLCLVSGSGYDMPFPYPDQIALCPHQRFHYIFSLVDSMNLQLEKIRRKTPEPLKNAGKKGATGAVPKTKNKNKENSNSNLKKMDPSPIDTNSGSPEKALPISQAKPKKYYIMNIQAKPINLSSKTNYQYMKEKKSKSQNVKRRQDQDHEKFIDFDTDCELGMEHLEQYRAKASRRDSDGNRNEPPSETTTTALRSRSDNPEKRSSETNIPANCKLSLGSADNGGAIDTLEQRSSEKRSSDKSLLGSSDSGEESTHSDGALLEQICSSEMDDTLIGSGSGDARICADTRTTDNQRSSGLFRSISDDYSLGLYIREGCSSSGKGTPPAEPMPYDLRMKRNCPGGAYAKTLEKTQPFSADSNLASSDSDPSSASPSPSVSDSESEYPSSNILEMPHQSFVECARLASLTSIGDLQKSRQSSHPSGSR